jgi:hypothetical protein
MSKFYEVSKRTGQQMEVYTKQGYNHLYNSNPKNVIKVMLLVFVAILFFVMGKGIILKVKKFFGLSDEQQEYEKEKEKADIATQKELEKQAIGIHLQQITQAKKRLAIWAQIMSIQQKVFTKIKKGFGVLSQKKNLE